MRDHREREVRVRLPVSAWLWPRRADERGLTPEQVRRVRESARWRHAPFWWRHLRLSLVGVCIVCAITSIVISIRNMAIDERWTSPAMASVMSAMVILALVFSGVRRLARDLQEHPVLIESNLEHGSCPACLYAIAAVPPEPDGCRVCPECGAAWRLPGGT